MKTKIATLIFGLVACSLAALAQVTADNTNAPAIDSLTNAATAAEISTNAVAADATTNAPVAEVATNAATVEIAPVTEAPVSITPDTNAPIIPLIVMDDVPLTDAIKNLARQANINYMLDPKINYGQPGPDNKVIPQPSVSIRWEKITASQALSALLNNYNLQMVEDPRTKIARVTVRDPAAAPALMTEVIQLKYASPSNVVAAVQSLLTDKRSKVVPDVRTSQLVLLATEREVDAVNSMVERLDAPTKQVLIEARLLETSMNPHTIKGINWSGTLSAQKIAFGNNLQENSPQDSLNNTLAQSFPKLLLDTARGFNPATAFLDADGVNAVLSFMNEDSETKVLSEPRTVTLDNETAHIEAGQNYPIINVTAGTANTTGGSQITYSNLTVKLDVTPRISANNYINLKVSPHVLRLDSVQRFISGGQAFDVPIFGTRTLDTAVMIPSGNTLVMGGLVSDEQHLDNTKVPLLGDIPGIGVAFRHNEKKRIKSNLMIFITPTIVQDADYTPTETDFLKTPLPHPDNHEWSSWDSTKPADWSKPTNPYKDEPVYADLPAK